MKTQSFKLFELLNLEAELAGATNNQTGEKIIEGLLNQKLPVVTKYHLNILLSNLSAEKKTIDALRDELIKKYGKEDENGNIGISMVIETGEVNDKGEPIKDINPAYIEFNDEYGELLNQEKEIQIPQIKLSDLDKIETKDNYVLIFKYLIEQPSVEEVK
jgi:molybdopterin converting factor small subunit